MDKHQIFAFGLEETCSLGVKNIGIDVRQSGWFPGPATF